MNFKHTTGICLGRPLHRGISAFFLGLFSELTQSLTGSNFCFRLPEKSLARDLVVASLGYCKVSQRSFTSIATCTNSQLLANYYEIRMHSMAISQVYSTTVNLSQSPQSNSIFWTISARYRSKHGVWLL